MTPPDWDAQATGVNDNWVMVLSVKSLWNGAHTLEEAASKTAACLTMLRGLLEREGWRCVHVWNGNVALAADSQAVEKRGYLTQYVDFAVTPECRRMGANEGSGDADEAHPYVLVDDQIRARLGLRVGAELDDMVGMRAHAAAAAATVLQHFCEAASAESDGALKVARHGSTGALQVQRIKLVGVDAARQAGIDDKPS